MLGDPTYGKEREWVEFASTAADRIGGPEGSAMFYFTFVELGDCSCEDKDAEFEKVKRWANS